MVSEAMAGDKQGAWRLVREEEPGLDRLRIWHWVLGNFPSRLIIWAAPILCTAVPERGLLPPPRRSRAV